MLDYDAEAIESTDLSNRDVRALTEVMTVLGDQGRVKDADGLYEVVTQSGSAYLVDAAAGVCDCHDYQKRDDVDECKHLRRVAYVAGDRRIPAWVDADALDDEVRDVIESDESAAVDAVETPEGTQAVATDGAGEKRVCDDCAHMSDLPCFDCYLDGHRDTAAAVAPDEVSA